MTKRKANPSKRGRKPKGAGEKLKQLTLRLTPTSRLGLELLARDRGVSISVVAEQLVAQSLQAQHVAGTTVYDLITELGGVDLQSPELPPYLREHVAESLMRDQPFLVGILPDALRRPHERLFLAAFSHLRPGSESDPGLIQSDIDLARQLLDACQIAHRQGKGKDALVDEWAAVFEVPDEN